MSDECRKCWANVVDNYSKLEQKRKEDIHILVATLALVLPVTYRELMRDLGMDDYVAIYAMQELVNKEKFNE